MLYSPGGSSLMSIGKPIACWSTSVTAPGLNASTSIPNDGGPFMPILVRGSAVSVGATTTIRRPVIGALAAYAGSVTLKLGSASAGAAPSANIITAALPASRAWKAVLFFIDLALIVISVSLT